MAMKQSEQHWCVEVSRSGENLVTLESRMLTGKPDLTELDLEVIRLAAHNLLAFAGHCRGLWDAIKAAQETVDASSPDESTPDAL